MAELITLLIGLSLFVLFIIMTNNIASMVKILRRIEMNSMSMKSSLEKLADSKVSESLKKDPEKMTTEEKARAFDNSK